MRASIKEAFLFKNSAYCEQGLCYVCFMLYITNNFETEILDGSREFFSIDVASIHSLKINLIFWPFWVFWKVSSFVSVGFVRWKNDSQSPSKLICRAKKMSVADNHMTHLQLISSSFLYCGLLIMVPWSVYIATFLFFKPTVNHRIHILSYI